ncbi:MAG: flagellar basal body rod protein FlgC [Paracoccaceae bacterium]
MSEFAQALRVSTSALHMQSGRLRLISENVANVDTPGYQRKTAGVEFHDTGFDAVAAVALGDVSFDPSEPEQVYDPSHPLADDSGHYLASNVDLVIEIADAQEAQRSYEANLKVFDQTRQMSSSLLDLLRR